jgi:hypothetical protein
MQRRFVELFLLLFLTLIGLSSPELPYNASRADFVFIPLAILVLTLPWTRWTWRWSDLAVAAYLLGALPALAVSSDRAQSAIELARQLYLVAIYGVCALAARAGFARTAATGLALGAAILSVIGLIFVVLQWSGEAPPAPRMGEFMQLPYLGETLRLRAMTASQAMLACLLTAAAPFAIALCSSDRARVWWAVTIAMIAAAGMTFSHALAGFAVAVLIASWQALAERPMLRRAAVGAAVIVVLALNFAATFSIRSVSYGDAGYADASTFHHAVDQGETRIGGATIIYTVMSYARIKQVAWQTFLEHPIAGIGLDRFHVATARAHTEGRLPPLYREVDPHSTLPGRLAETGIIGGLTLVLLWLAWGRMAVNVSGHALGYAAMAALAGLIVSSLNADIMNFRFLWVVAGLMRGLQEANGMVIGSGRDTSAIDGTR